MHLLYCDPVPVQRAREGETVKKTEDNNATVCFMLQQQKAESTQSELNLTDEHKNNENKTKNMTNKLVVPGYSLAGNQDTSFWATAPDSSSIVMMSSV